MVELEKLESQLQQWWNEAKSKDISTNKVCKAFGKAMLRACLHVLGKGLLGREEVDHDSLKDIGDLFTKALTSSSLPASTATAAPPQAPSGTMVSLTEAQSPMFLAKKATGLAVGKSFMLKDYPDRLWTCIKLGDSGATFEHIDVLSQQSCKVQVAVLELCEKVKSTKAKPLQLIPTDVMDNLFASNQCLEESEKATLYNLLLECYNSFFALGSAFAFTFVVNVFMSFVRCCTVWFCFLKPILPGNDMDSDEFLLVNFKTMYTAKAFKKNGISMIPMPDKTSCIVPLDSCKSTIYGQIKRQGKAWAIMPAKAAKEHDDGTYSGTFVPFWLCKPVEEGKMVEKWITFQDAQILTLTNKESMEKHEPIGLPMPEDKKGPKKRKMA